MANFPPFCKGAKIFCYVLAWHFCHEVDKKPQFAFKVIIHMKTRDWIMFEEFGDQFTLGLQV